MTDIQVTLDHYAPPQFRYVATEGDFDLGCRYGQGRTPLEAIVDLLNQLEERAPHQLGCICPKCDPDGVYE